MKWLLFTTIFLTAGCHDPTANESDLYAVTEHLQDAEVRDAVLYQSILEKKAAFDEIQEVFKSHNKQAVSNSIKALRKYSSDKKVVGLLKSVWDKDISNYPEFSWRLLKSPSIKVSIAFALHDFDGDHEDTYTKFIYRQVNEGDTDAKSNAAMSLGLIGSNEDIPSLVNLIVEDNVRVAASAASALGILRTPESKAALKKLLQSNDLNAEKKKVIRQVLNSAIWKYQSGVDDNKKR